MIRMVRSVAATLAIANLAVAHPALAVRSANAESSAGAKMSSSEGARAPSRVGDAESLDGNERFIIPAVVIVTTVALILALTNGHHDGNANQHPASP